MSLCEFDLSVITECTAMANPGRLIFSSSNGYYVEAPRINQKIEVPKESIDRMVAAGVGSVNRYGGFEFDAKKCEEIYFTLFTSKEIPHPEHPGKKIQYCEYHNLFR